MAKKVKLATFLRAGRASLAGAISVTPPSGNQPPFQKQTIPNFSLPQGGQRLATPYFEDPEGDPIYFRKASSPTNVAEITVDEQGNFIVAPNCPLGTYQVAIDFAATPFVSGVSKKIAEIPEIWFVVGYAEVEEMGIYVCDPSNRTQPGDLWWLTGDRLQRHEVHGGGDWTPAEPVVMEVLDGNGQLPAGVTWDAATARFLWNGGPTPAPAVDGRNVRLSIGSESREFLLRCLKPSVICTSNAAGLPANLAGIRVVANNNTCWTSMKTDGTTFGNTEANPRVCLFADSFTPRQNFFVGDASSNPDYRYMYICGVPLNLSQIGQPFDFDQLATATDLPVELFSVTRMRGQHFKNIRLGNIGAVLGVQESGFPTRWTFQKVDFLRRHPDSAASNVENGTDWEPNPYPTETNDFKLFVSNVKMLQGGYVSGSKHGFYVETSGYTFGHWNNCHLLGANKCSIIKTLLTTTTIRNTYAPACATPLTPYDEPFWAQEIFNIHSHTGVVLYNNLVYGGRDSNWGNGAPYNWGRTISMGTGLQNGALSFSQCRRPVKGSDIPQYPYLSYSPSLPAGGGPPSPYLGSFPVGSATFVNQAFWDAIDAAGMDQASNPYLFKHFISYNMVRHMTATPSKTIILRADGTHPLEDKQQFSSDTYQLGCPPGWIERQTIFLLNNRYENWAEADFLYSTKDSSTVVLIDNGTNFISWDLVLDAAHGSAAGTVRARANGEVRDMSGTLKTAIGWTSGLDPPAAFNTMAELFAISVSSVENPVRWPPAKWPATALGAGPHPERVDPYIPRIVNLQGHVYSDKPRSPTNPASSTPDWFEL